MARKARKQGDPSRFRPRATASVAKKKKAKKATRTSRSKTSVRKKKRTAKPSKTTKTRAVRSLRTRRSETSALVLDTLTGPQRVARAKLLLNEGKTYPQGCSGFVCDVLQITYRQAKEIMSGSNTAANSIGKQPNYGNVSPGDVCGWLKADDANDPKEDHVTIWIGEEPDIRFIDVRSPGSKPRKLGNGYELNQTLWKSKNV